jgi:hypothetical protein
MTEDEDDIFDMILQAVESFPPEAQKAAEDYLFKCRAALEYLNDLKTGVVG